MRKNSRQLKILELIENGSVSTQEEIAKRLKEAGFEVTQATISRDIKLLGLFKLTEGENTRYTKEANRNRINAKTSEVLSGVIQKIFESGGNLFLEVENGCGRLIKDTLRKVMEKVVPVMADDDTVVAFYYDEGQAIKMANKLREYF